MAKISLSLESDALTQLQVRYMVWLLGRWPIVGARVAPVKQARCSQIRLFLSLVEVNGSDGAIQGCGGGCVGRLAEVMPGKAPVWARIVRKHGLAPTPYGQAAVWSYGDFVFQPEYDIMSDMTRARQYGFHETLDTERMFIELFDFYRSQRIIPAR